METNTKYFGTITYTTDEVITFAHGIFGFEESKKFLLIRFAEDNEGMLCLQNIEEPSLAFVVINPFAFLPTYAPSLSADELKTLAAADSTELMFYNICVLKDIPEESTVNLRCPLAINPENKNGMQVILDNEKYSFRQPLNNLAKES